LAAPAVLTASSLRARVTRILSCRRFIAPAWSRGIATGVVSALCAVALGVGGVKLVEATAFAGPLESIRTVRSSPERLAAIAALPRSAPVATPGPARQPFASTRSTRRPAAKRPAPATPAATGPEPPVKLESHSGVDSTVHQAATEGAVDAAAPEPSTVLDAPRAQPPGLAIERDRSPWAEAADTGTAIGRKSKDAGVATAGFFTRFARRVAGSF
jgi:hypothetical protein